MVLEIFSGKKELNKLFWGWWCSEEIMKRYQQDSRRDLWENYRDKVGFKTSVYKLQFMAKSPIEQAQAMIDFIEHNFQVSITTGFTCDKNYVKYFYGMIDTDAIVREAGEIKDYLTNFNYLGKSKIDKVDCYIECLEFFVENYDPDFVF